MRQIIKTISIFFLGVVFTISLFSFQSLNVNNDSLNDSSDAIFLKPPFAEVVEASATTPPLDTGDISFIAYYKRGIGWTLSDIIPAFISYIDGGNYYDGFVRVWDSGRIGSTSPIGSDTYVDVYVRVRADGWVIGWLNRFEHNPGSIVWWGHKRNDPGSPPAYSTTLSRAIEIIFIVTGIQFPGYEEIYLYDYSEPLATRLIMFGHSIKDSFRIYYYTIPVTSTITPIKLLIRAGGYVSLSPPANNELRVDGGLIYSKGSATLEWGWSTYQISAWEKGVQHSIEQSSIKIASHSVAFILWSE